jgi:peptidoglycan glycosyltransferase
VPPQTTDPIQNYGGSSCGGTMIEVFYPQLQHSPFAQHGHRARTREDGERHEGVGHRRARSRSTCRVGRQLAFGEVEDFTDQLPLLAIGGFGQGNDVMVPLHMAMVAATVANGGKMMVPHVIDATLYHDGSVLDRTEPDVWKTPISPTDVASQLLDR